MHSAARKEFLGAGKGGERGGFFGASVCARFNSLGVGVSLLEFWGALGGLGRAEHVSVKRRKRKRSFLGLKENPMKDLGAKDLKIKKQKK